ncbi:tRNA (adenosine(37)-N6)-threonylcarbamoyltransferase complex ATPase subunit type 1 TsaE [Leeuwenhoekiella marinoflava]|uniref:tRNA threonylcarbamoyladenosine biosynthesis protein TsaE n=2 Tax=Leeuwenhoekiella marinoflava TaxID=988 RepID=A0A4Q0PNL6_9FLAO|nr:tRNA (adenosine(37)-N6)-threonylcarbamoyltransferase complex ATPase subunit type 1 TsaE [Leeuwenhoekiella marinoflava]RXG32166.1 tRNA threonylcarbamoyladenosine biosynthesis protein TsaE [Leeuwenhoekiella marinoflava]SHE84800.1 tRNA threonylcarbamoyladenosine biosynthesis protein TsaE [Leeuwenhoekiella marinoflava DSM 3653]
MEIDYDLSEVSNIAKTLIDHLKYSTILFYGDLGAGKTTLIKAIVKELGSNDKVSSPTFSLINEYRTADNHTIFHLDLYRLKNENEAFDLGIEEILETDSLKLIEWPQKINTLLENDVHSAKISSINVTKRKIEFQ